MYLSSHVTCFFVRAAAAKGNHVRFGCSKCWIQGPNGKLCGIGSMIDKLYRLDSELAPVEHNIREHAAVASENHDMNL